MHMEQWEDQAIVLSARSHGENGAVVSVLTQHHGRRMGYVHGATSQNTRATLQVGNLVHGNWRAKGENQLGILKVEDVRGYASEIAQDAGKLYALQSACCLLDAALSEREEQSGVFEGTVALLHILSENNSDPSMSDNWGFVSQKDLWMPAYIFWEINLLGAIGFSLNLEECAGGGEGELTPVSPKTGRAVSAEKAAPYKDKLLPLPKFLRPNRDAPTKSDIDLGLSLTSYFLEHKLFAQDTRGSMPSARIRLQEYISQSISL